MQRRALIMDLDGVLREWEPMTSVEVEYGIPVGSVLAAAFSPVLLQQAITGAIDDQRWRAEIATTLRAQHGRAGEDAVLAWSRSCGTVDVAVLGLVRRYRRLAPVALLSNATSRLPDDLSRLGLDSEFDHIFGSYRLGVAKPDPRAFELACAEMGVEPRECMFVDDTATHLDGARSVGLHVHHYQNSNDLAAFLDLAD